MRVDVGERVDLSDDVLVCKWVIHFVEGSFVVVGREFWNVGNDFFIIVWINHHERSDVLRSFEIIREPTCMVSNTCVFPVDKAARGVVLVDVDVRDGEDKFPHGPVNGVSEHKLGCVFHELGEFIGENVSKLDHHVWEHLGKYGCFRSYFELY